MGASRFSRAHEARFCYSGTVRRKRPPSAEPLVPSGTPVPETPVPDSLVPDAVLEKARSAGEADPGKKGSKCVVCGEECAASSAGGLCWGCRRLKFSAWRDSDTQIPPQE